MLMFISLPATCNVSDKSYNHGDTIILHNITYPIDQALCTSCLCSAGDITDCNSYYCDIGLGGPPIEVCDNWVTGEEGVCCPRCGKNNKNLPGISLKECFYRWPTVRDMLVRSEGGRPFSDGRVADGKEIFPGSSTAGIQHREKMAAVNFLTMPCKPDTGNILGI